MQRKFWFGPDVTSLPAMFVPLKEAIGIDMNKIAGGIAAALALTAFFATAQTRPSAP